ncbi:MAG: phosphotransferase [Pseudolysinimonas sp.]|uniref:phosphotransferase n=1 Tax=Pseudolysinimonas sp. TaxID=2680009 RepID=UPI003C784DE5
MARSPLTLAALATCAVADLDIVGAQSFGAPGGDFDAALLTGRDGRHWVVRVPRSERAEQEQSADLVALRALSAGVRARLPFTVSTFAGQVPVDGTRAVVSEFVYGSKVPLGSMSIELAASIGSSIAAIHALPPNVVIDAGLPSHSAVEALRAVVAVMDRAAATGLVPAGLLARWERASEESTLWQFTPTVINGALGSDSFLSANDDVTGMLGWHNLRVGDPAADLQWLAGASLDVADSAFAAYSRVRGSVDRQLRQRAALLSELEIAKWLLHGTETKSTEIVDDAVGMLSALVDETSRDLMNPIGGPQVPLGVSEVEELLERTSRLR